MRKIQATLNDYHIFNTYNKEGGVLMRINLAFAK